MLAMERFFESAWQPFTPRGVARFACAPAGRLWMTQCVIALLAAAVVTWFVRVAWYPVVNEAVGNLPATGVIRAGQLSWDAGPPRMLAEGRFLSIAVDPALSGNFRGPAHVQVAFGSGSLEICSLLGCLHLPYPLNATFGLNHNDAMPWWGAWSPPILALGFGATLVGLLLVWRALGWVYCGPALLLAFFANRGLDGGGARRLSGAAQMPGALFLTLAVVCYGLGWMDPVRLLVAFAAHFVVSWVYLAVSPFFLPSVEAVVKTNPFFTPPAPEMKPEKTRDTNPFRSGGN